MDTGTGRPTDDIQTTHASFARARPARRLTKRTDHVTQNKTNPPIESQQTNSVVAPEDRVEYYRKMFEASFAREPRRVTVLCKVNPSSM